MARLNQRPSRSSGQLENSLPFGQQLFKQTNLILFSRTLAKAINRSHRQETSCSAYWDSSEVKPSPFDKLRAGSAGLSLELEFSHTLFSPWVLRGENIASQCYSPPALRFLVAVSVAMLVGNYHGNGMPTKPLTRSTLPQPWLQPFAHDHRSDRQPPLYSFPGSICEYRSRP